MATYVIGDVQGCFEPLERLLAHIAYDRHHDSLWFTGDLVNRGPQSLEVLRFIKTLSPQTVIVLGNHDLHLLAVHYGVRPLKASDTLYDLLHAPDCAELCDWLRQQPLAHYDSHFQTVMTHAGIPPVWSLQNTLHYAAELSTALKSNDVALHLNALFNGATTAWDDTLTGPQRLQTICNYLTHMRFCNKEGQLDLSIKTGIDQAPSDFFPWFRLPRALDPHISIVFGHWAALEGQTYTPHVFCVDTGCVWGRRLSALRLDDLCWFSVKAQLNGDDDTDYKGWVEDLTR